MYRSRKENPAPLHLRSEDSASEAG